MNRAMTSVSLGALYQSKAVCHFSPMSLGKMDLTCEGHMSVLKVLDVGFVNPTSNVCLINDKKNPVINRIFPCNDQILDLPLAEISKNCVGKKSCSLVNLKSLLNPQGTCVKDKTYLKKHVYIQVACGSTEQQLKGVLQYSLLQVSLGVFGCLSFIVLMKYDYMNYVKIDKLIYRSFALYARDYTIEI